jgi:D-alanyl-D-alanine carboxypeptidase
MKRKKRGVKSSKPGILKSPLAYVVLILILLLLIVFIVSRFDKPETPELNEDQNPVVIIPSDDPVTTAKEISEDDLADNPWAMFLVNNQNPLPEDYDKTLEDEIGMTLVFEDYREYYMDSRAAPYILKMLKDSAEDGVDLFIVSTYRTQEYQQTNLDNSIQDRIDSGMDYETAYADAIESVALPGRSEHNAGLAADIMTPAYTSMDDDGFKNTPEYKWLSENAEKYGFILRYPEGKQDVTGIIFEPWHYRFVGVYYANKIKESGLTLEEYFEERGWVDEDGKATEHKGPFESLPQTSDGGIDDSEPPIVITAPPDPNVSTVTVNSGDDEPIVVE